MGNSFPKASKEEQDRTLAAWRANQAYLMIGASDLSTAVRNNEIRPVFEWLAGRKNDEGAVGAADVEAWFSRGDPDEYDSRATLRVRKLPLLFYAIRNRSEEMAHLLVGRGCPTTLSLYSRILCESLDQAESWSHLEGENSRTIKSGDYHPNEYQYVTLTDFAAFMGDKLVLERLLKAEKTAVSPSALCYAAYGGHAAAILALKDKLPSVDDVYTYRMWPATALGVAAGRGYLAAVNVLLKIGANANHLPVADVSGSPLFQAILGPSKWFKNDDDEAGIIKGKKGGPCCFFIRMAQLLKVDTHKAPIPTRGTYRKIIRALLSAGADTELCVTYQGKNQSLLMWAIELQNFPAIMELCLAGCASADNPGAVALFAGPSKRLHYNYTPSVAREEIQEALEGRGSDRFRALSPTAQGLFEVAYDEVRKQIARENGVDASTLLVEG